MVHKGGRARSVRTVEIVNEIEQIVTFEPQLTLKEIKNKIEERHDELVISKSSVDNCLNDLRITLKLSHRELDRVNMADKIILRKEYSLWYNNRFNNDFSRIVFVDESSFNLHLKRSQARSKQGTRAIARTPIVQGRSVSLIASISISQMCFCKTISNSIVNSDIFSEYIRELCVYLRDEMQMQNACIILDNARVHKRESIQSIVNEFNFEFKILSPYSYMLNPIENAFSKIKSGVRSRLRIGETGILSNLILSEVRNVSSEDCVGYFRYDARNITNCVAE